MALSPLVILLIYLFCPIQGAPDKIVFTKTDKQAFVRIHNWLRETAVPTAVNMNYVIWSEKLEALAAKAVARCSSKHNYDGEFGGLGENMYIGGRLDPVMITMLWFTEKSMYNHDGKACKTNECRHYLQVMGAGVKSIGCARKGNCPGDNKFTICEYDYLAGGSVFVYGPPCSACPFYMSFCLNNLCISKELAQNLSVIEGTAKKLECKLECKNCGKRDTSFGLCKCKCGMGSTGALCEINRPIKTDTCSACTDVTSCLNGAEEDTTDPKKCKCICKTGYAGDRCEMAKDVFDNSVNLAISTDYIDYLKAYKAMLPVSTSFLKSKLWSDLQGELSKIVNIFCQKNAANFVQCCPGKTFSADASSKSHVKAGDVKFTESSVSYTLEGSMYVLIHAVVTDSALCSAGGGGGSRARTPCCNNLRTKISAHLCHRISNDPAECDHQIGHRKCK